MRNDRQKYPLVDTAMLLVGDVTGFGQSCMTPDEARERIEWLRWRVEEGWVESIVHHEFDTRVRDLARTVVRMCDGWEFIGRIK